MRKFLIQALMSLGFVVVVVLLLAINVLLVWVATGPRDLKRALPYIETTLENLEDDIDIRVGKGLLIWDGWRNPVDIRLSSVDVFSKEGVRIAAFPDVSVGIDFSSVLFGKLRLDSLIIRRPVIGLYQDDKGEIYFSSPDGGFEQKSADEDVTEEVKEAAPAENVGEAAEAIEVAEAPVEEMYGPPYQPPPPPEPEAILGIDQRKELYAFFMRGHSEHLENIKKVQVEDAVVGVVHRRLGILMEAENVDLELHRDLQGVRFMASAMVKQKDRDRSLMMVEVTPEEERKQVALRVRTQSLMPETLAPLVEEKEQLASVKLPFSGWATMILKESGNISSYKYLLHGGKGEVQSEYLHDQVAVEEMQIEGGGRGLQEFNVSKFSLNLGKYIIRGNGLLQAKEKGPLIKLQAEVKDVPVEDVSRFWPPSLAPVSREWVLTNITHGHVSKAGIKVNIQPGDLAHEDLPKNTILAEVAFDHAKLTYLPNHPQVEDITGKVIITAQSLRAEVAKAHHLSGTHVSDATVDIDNLVAENPRIEVAFTAKGPAKDIASFLTRKPAQHAQRLNIDPETITGSGSGKVKLGFNYFVPKKPDGTPRDDMGVDYDISATMTDVSQKGFMNKFDIANASGDMVITNEKLEFKGSGKVFGAPSKAEIAYLFTPKNGKEMFVTVESVAPVSLLSRLGLEKMDFLSGNLGVKAKVEQGGDATSADVELDLTNAALNVKEARYMKALRVPAGASFQFDDSGDDARFSRFSYQSGSDKISGKATLSKDFSVLKHLELKDAAIGKNRFSLNYSEQDGIPVVQIAGSYLDVSPWMEKADPTPENKEVEDEGFSFENFPPIALDMDVGTLLVREGYPISNVRGNLNCDREKCSSSRMTGMIGKSPFLFAITPKGTRQRSLQIQADDAGQFLRAMDIYDNMKGGKIDLSGTFNDADPVRPLKATLKISEHSIENAPVLAKLLTLASLTGFVDVLSGNGISFTKLEAPFTLADDVITLEDAKTYGSSIGLTAEGTITFPETTLNFKGTVVPSYTLNNVFGGVPIIGDVITGGGEGVFAARYSISGSPDDPSVSVNPLSILTPGFLRGLFDVFDAPEKKPAAKKKETPKGVPEKKAE